ncbi:MAG: hypothetical protein ACRC10_08785 [Thermoguttaceae bacterium]
MNISPFFLGLSCVLSGVIAPFAQLPLVYLALIALVPAMFFIIFFGEKWRANHLRHRKMNDDHISVPEVHYESQNPMWPYVLLLTIYLACTGPLVVELLSLNTLQMNVSKETAFYVMIAVILSITFVFAIIDLFHNLKSGTMDSLRLVRVGNSNALVKDDFYGTS